MKTFIYHTHYILDQHTYVKIDQNLRFQIIKIFFFEILEYVKLTMAIIIVNTNNYSKI